MADVLQADLREALVACETRRGRLEDSLRRDVRRRHGRMDVIDRNAAESALASLERVSAWLRGHLRDMEEEGEF